MSFLLTHARVDDVPHAVAPAALDGAGRMAVVDGDHPGFTEADALDGAKHVASECSKSVANAVGHPLKGPELVLRIWESTAQSVLKEVDSGRNIFVPGLGTFGRKESVGILFAPLEEFVQSHGLDVSFFINLIPESPRRLPTALPVVANASPRRNAATPVEEALGLAASLDLLPRVKHSVASVARLLEVSSEVVLQALQAMVHRMGQQMASTAMVAVSFAPLGCFICEHRCLRFGEREPLLSMEVTNFGPTIPLRKLLSTLEKRKSKLSIRPQPPKTSRPAGQRPGPSPGQPPGARASTAGRRAMHRSMPAKPQVFPDLLNAFSRTQAAPFVGMEDPASPSERIAASFTASASKLTWRPCQVPRRSLRWQPSFLEQPFLEADRGGEDYAKHFTATIEADSPLDLELKEADVSHAQFFETLFRYGYYFDTIPDAYLAPFPSAWTQKIRSRTGDGHFPELLEKMWQEVLHDYRQAIRKVIIEHVLKEEKAKKRTGIFFVPSPMALWGTQAFQGIEGTAGGLPEGWESITKRRLEMADLLLPCSRASASLLDLWHQKYDTLLLVNLPSGELMDLQSFCAAQGKHMNAVRARLETWLSEVVEILKPCQRSSWPVTLLSTQVRGVVDRSIEAFLQFFGPQQMEAFLRVGLRAKGSEIVLTTSLEEIEVSLVQVFKNFVVSLSDLSFTVTSGPENTETTVTLWSVTLEESHVQEAEKSITESILHNLERVEAALAPFDQFKYLLVEDVRIKKLSEDTLTQDCVMEELKTLRAVQESIRINCAEEICLHMVSIQCSHINETLRSKAEEAIQILLESILRHLLLRNDHLCKSFEMVVNQVVKKPTSEMELVDLEMYIEEFRATGLNELLREFDSIREWLSFLFTCENQLMLGLLKEKHFQAIYDSAHWVGSIQDRVFDGTNLKREREALESKFKEQRNKFLEDLEGYNEQVDQLSECSNLRQVDEYLERIQVLKNNFTRAHVEAEKLNAKEKRFGWEVRSPFEQLKRGEHALEPHFALWSLAYNTEASMRTWLKGPLFHLDPAKVDVEVRGMRKEAMRLRELFLAGGGVVYPSERIKSVNIFPAEEEEPLDGKVPAPAVVAGQLNQQAQQMQETHLKLLYVLCNQCLQARHWDQISGVLGFGLEPDASFTLAKAIELDVGNSIDELQEISDTASAEYQVELAADAMEDEWKSLSFTFESWKATGTSVFAEDRFSKIRQLLEDQMQRTLELKELEAAEAWEERLEEWQEWLQQMSDTVSTWAQLQDLWTSLEVLFSGRDIYKQLPVDIQTFRKVDKYWRNLMSTLQSHPLARDISKMPQLLQNLSENRDLLQGIRDRIGAV